MRFVSFSRDGSHRIGCPRDGQIVDLSIAAPALPHDLLSLLEQGPEAMQQAADAAQNAGADALVSAGSITYLPLIPRPPKIICIGRNYAAHAKVSTDVAGHGRTQHTAHAHTSMRTPPC